MHMTEPRLPQAFLALISHDIDTPELRESLATEMRGQFGIASVDFAQDGVTGIIVRTSEPVLPYVNREAVSFCQGYLAAWRATHC